jgi:hypothetical protein
MKKFLVIFVIVIFLTPEFVYSETSHVRLLVHGTRTIENFDIGNIGIGGWLIAPSIGDAPDKWLTVVGPRFENAGFNLEIMFGALILKQDVKPMIDIRVGLTPKLLHIPVSVGGVFEYNFSTESFYSFLQIDYVLPAKLGLIGIESENSYFLDKEDDLSVGAHLILPVGKGFAFVLAYQFHKDESHHLWVRVVFNL